MSFNIRDYVSDDHIESIGEIATGQARIIQVLTLDNSQKDKEIERLNNIINELEKHLEKIIIDGGTRGSMTFWYRQIYDYLQELKGSDSNVKD